jgi:hypothetical protein
MFYSMILVYYLTCMVHQRVVALLFLAFYVLNILPSILNMLLGAFSLLPKFFDTTQCLSTLINIV